MLRSILYAERVADDRGKRPVADRAPKAFEDKGGFVLGAVAGLHSRFRRQSRIGAFEDRQIAGT